MDLLSKNSTESRSFFADEDSLDSYSTELPAPDVSSPIVTIVLIAVAAVFTIGLLFGLAVFIDCRHQKLVESGKRDPERKLFSISMPKFFNFRRFSNEEEESYADKIYGDGNVTA